jgi:RimJ/RimL family protein N-acetyltransferase
MGVLAAMYDRFQPLGAALGLPPWREETRHRWVQASLSHEVNLAACLPGGEVVGHCFLAADHSDSAELAVFVDHRFRGRGLGTVLVATALQWARLVGLRRVWALTTPENNAALRLQEKCGFRTANSGSLEMELEIELPVAWNAPSLIRKPGFQIGGRQHS